MKKLLLLAAVAIMSVCTMNAQTEIKYQGEVDLGYSLGVGDFASNRINIHTIQGVKIGDYFSTGIGLGVDLYHEGGTSVMIPVFLNMKGYLPNNSNITPYLSFDIGGGFGVGDTSGLSGMIISPAIGIKTGAFKAQLGYNVQKISESGIGINMSAMQLKLGFAF
ncbi:MAG: hypothetical protein IKM58_03975 [Tidjanibacter sp.]|nr:hypothetical protein [Tidjanibacter sp.]